VLNQIFLVGKIINMELKEKEIYLMLSVGKKDKNGVYETSLIPCRLIGSMVNVTQEYCKKGNIVGIKGSLENKDDKLYVMTDKLSILKSN